LTTSFFDGLQARRERDEVIDCAEALKSEVGSLTTALYESRAVAAMLLKELAQEELSLARASTDSLRRGAVHERLAQAQARSECATALAAEAELELSSRTAAVSEEALAAEARVLRDRLAAVTRDRARLVACLHTLEPDEHLMQDSRTQLACGDRPYLRRPPAGEALKRGVCSTSRSSPLSVSLRGQASTASNEGTTRTGECTVAAGFTGEGTSTAAAECARLADRDCALGEDSVYLSSEEIGDLALHSPPESARRGCGCDRPYAPDSPGFTMVSPYPRGDYPVGDYC